MGKIPDVIIFARHSDRMDSVNPEWALSAEAPYDPPLTHGGWIKAQVLGEQIMKMLWHEHDDQHQHQHQHKKRKIVIHSSPYLRCTQSAVAVGAGISKAEGELTRAQAEQERAHSGRHYSSPARSRTLGSSSESSREIAQRVANRANLQRVGQFSKPTLRIDACFGEWGSADYFKLLDGSFRPPPDSTVMMAKAKGYLGQPAEDLQGVYYQGDAERRVHFQSPDRLNDRHASSRPSPLSIGSLSDSLAHSRLSTLSPISTSSSGTSTPTSVVPPHLPTDVRPVRPALKGGRRTQYYEYPITSYAGSGRDYIPKGFVEHARDHCLLVDEEWDSMKEPQSWGHGGTVPEEWPALHNRMRKALHNMITWYTHHPATESPQSSDADSPTSPGGTSSQSNDDEDTELVLIILTHQSGCNALAGAFLNTPILIDFAIASLSLAVLKDPSAPSRRPTTPGSTSTVPSAFGQYELKNTNYVEHLRPAPAQPSRRSSLGPIQTTPAASKRPRATSYVVKKDPAHAAEMSAVAATAGLWGGQGHEEEGEDVISPMMSESGGGLWLGRRESSAR